MSPSTLQARATWRLASQNSARAEVLRALHGAAVGIILIRL